MSGRSLALAEPVDPTLTIAEEVALCMADMNGEGPTATDLYRDGRLGAIAVLTWTGVPFLHRGMEFAAGNEHLELVKWLIKNGCPVTGRDLKAAAEVGHLEIVKCLMKAEPLLDRGVAIGCALENRHTAIAEYLKNW